MRASNAFRLLPLALVTVALLTIAALSYSQDRYNFGAHHWMSGRVYYECTSSSVRWGNAQALSINKDKEQALDNAYANMAKIDGFDPNPPIPPAPSRNRLETVVGWIIYAVELTAQNINNYRYYNSQQIIDGVYSHYNGLLETLDGRMHDRTGNCAIAQARLNASQDSAAGMTSYSYGVAWYGFNEWLGIPAKAPRNRKVTMYCVANC